MRCQLHYLLIEKKNNIFRKSQIILENRLLKNSLYTGIALGFVGLVPFIFNILVARTFGQEILGSINIAISFSLLITVFITNFFGTSGNKFLSEYRGSKKLQSFKLIFLNIIIGPIIVLLFICLLLKYYWTYFVSIFSLEFDLFIPIISYICARTFYIIGRQIQYGVDLIIFYARNEIIADIIIITLIIIMCFYKTAHLVIYSFVIGYSIFILFSAFTLLLKYKSFLQPLKLDVDYKFKPILIKYYKYGLITMIGIASSTGSGYLSILFTAHFLSIKDAGLYTAVMTIISIMMFLPRLVTQVLLPELSKLFGAEDKSSIINTLKSFFWPLFFISLIINLSIYLFAEDILLLFGKSFSSGKWILRIMIPGIFIQMVSVPLITLLTSTKFVNISSTGGVIILIISVSSWAILVPEYQLHGIAIGYLFGVISGYGYQIIMALIKVKLILPHKPKNYFLL